MQTYYITWNYDLEIEKICNIPKQGQIYKMIKNNIIVNDYDHYSNKQKIKYSQIEFNKNVKELYVTCYTTFGGGGSYHCVSNMLIFDNFEDVLEEFEDCYKQDHFYECHSCDICNKKNGKKKCLKLAKIEFQTKEICEYLGPCEHTMSFEKYVISN